MKNRRTPKTVILFLVIIQMLVMLGCKWISGSNHAPTISEDVIFSTTTESNLLGEITGVRTKITIQASDQDEDVLTFSWTASNGTVTGKGPSGTWQRQLTSSGELVPGSATVVVSDGRGGEAQYTYSDQ
jgi:hypothetical protein